MVDRLRRIAAQSDHNGERQAASAQAAKMRGSTVIYELAIARMGRRIIQLEHLARDFPAMADGLRELAERERETRRQTMMMNGDA